jgi:hypothetical protein
MILYTSGAFLVFSPKNDLVSWLVVLVATVFWPLVLPSILRKKLLKSAPVAIAHKGYAH